MRSLNLFRAVLVLGLVPLVVAGSETKPSAPKMKVGQIVDKNVTARGGLSAWRSVQTMEMKGKMEAGGNQRASLSAHADKVTLKVVPQRPKEQVKLPFVMDLERGRKQRIEIQFKGQTALQVYNGVQGWKVRPFLNRHEVESFTAEELKAASTQAELDGLLIDYAAAGSKVELEGTEQVERHNAYNLKVTDKSGNVRPVWVDPETFLETKVEGTPRRLDGKYHPVATYFRDYLLETTVQGVSDIEKIEIESIVSNPKLDDHNL